MARPSSIPIVKVDDQNFTAFIKAWPKHFDVVFFAGIREGALILKEMRAQGLTQLFGCGDGCWDTKAFISAAEGAASKSEGMRVLSAAPALGEVPGSAEFAAKYTAKHRPINNYAASSYDAARVLMPAIAEAAKRERRQPSRAAVVAALRALTFQGIAYAKPTEKGDNSPRSFSSMWSTATASNTSTKSASDRLSVTARPDRISRR